VLCGGVHFDSNSVGAGPAEMMERCLPQHRSHKLASAKQSWYARRQNRGRPPNPSELAEAKEWYNVFGEPGTAKTKSSLDKLRCWINNAPLSDTVAKSACENKTTNVAMLRERAVMCHIEELLDNVARAQGGFLEKNIPEIARDFSSTCNGGCGDTATVSVPVRIEPMNVRSKNKSVGTQGELTWHGTRTGNIDGIRRHGLLIPGHRDMPGQGRNRPIIPVTNGQVHGRGIYCTRDVITATCYADRSALLLCSVNPRGAYRTGHIMVVKQENNIKPLYRVTVDRLPVSALLGNANKCNAYARAAASRRTRANAQKRRAKAQNSVATLLPPPGFVESGKSVSKMVLPVAGQRKWATDAINFLQRANSTNVLTKQHRREKSKQQSKKRNENQFKRAVDHHFAAAMDDPSEAEQSITSAELWAGDAWGMHDDSVITPREKWLAQKHKHATKQRKATDQSKKLAEAKREGLYSDGDRQRHDKAARIVKQKKSSRSGRRGAADEAERIAKKLKKKQGKRPQHRRHK
jgi:hypothetical protein